VPAAGRVKDRIVASSDRIDSKRCAESGLSGQVSAHRAATGASSLSGHIGPGSGGQYHDPSLLEILAANLTGSG